jgi:hypothetical protein
MSSTTTEPADPRAPRHVVLRSFGASEAHRRRWDREELAGRRRASGVAADRQLEGAIGAARDGTDRPRSARPESGVA